ncbi:TolB family protein [Moritella viscosa]
MTEHNYITYDDESYPLGMPEYNVYKAKEWPREDLDNAESYDQPRLQFFWDNGNSRKMKSDAYEKRQKIWSMKMDGTDLRLVTDDFDGRTRGTLRRSPNNRYLAYAYANDGLHKVLFDLKTQESIILGSSSTLPILVWAEDSSYLYYSNGREYIKYTLATKKKEAVDIRLTPQTVIYANGKYAWAKNRYHKVFIDVENKTWFAVDNKGVDKWKIHTMDNISVNGDEYQMGAAWVTLYAMDKGGNKLSYKRWTPIGTGRSARLSNVYNAFANNGRFFTKEGK